MKKIVMFLALIIANLSYTAINAQDSTAARVQLENQLVVPRSLLTPEQINQLNKMQKVEQVTQDLENYRKWAGMGKEIGVAINDGLKAVSDQTASFAETKPGKLTMILIAWKVLGDDVAGLTRAITGIAVGVPMLIGFVLVWLWVYRRTTSKKKLLESEEGKKKVYKHEDTWYTERPNLIQHKYSRLPGGHHSALELFGSPQVLSSSLSTTQRAPNPKGAALFSFFISMSTKSISKSDFDRFKVHSSSSLPPTSSALLKAFLEYLNQSLLSNPLYGKFRPAHLCLAREAFVRS